RGEIDDALAELESEIGRGAHPREVEHIVLRTRPAKQHTPTDNLVASWRERAARHGLTPDALAAVTRREPIERTVDAETLFASISAPDGICAGGSVFTRADALGAF